MIGLSCSEATARAAATIVAVAPTLDARSQVSPEDRCDSNEAMVIPLLHPFCVQVDHLTEGGVIALGRFQAMSGEQVRVALAGGLPAVGGEVGAGIRAVVEIHQGGHVEIETVAFPPLVGALHAAAQVLLVDLV